ncbi:hypothetical protein LRS06_21755 [Hymenobacter sp. J193]|uniref:hypothetical protein n=1 Tax=Hymenobacter sp. J193 TaxID=2898429 RepID=UPI002151B14F|nr:hypothetical protein [Hymenobacter sp. J193]MCR5890356.1 hypothetical protein [Hymenobacter sp. J193]
MATLLPTPAEAAATLQQDTSMLQRTREQARNAALLAAMMACGEQARVLSRALAAVEEPVDLPTQVYLIGRLYRHVATIYAGRLDTPTMRLEPHGIPASEVFKERGEFLHLVSQQLALAVAA